MVASVIATYQQGIWRMALMEYDRTRFDRQIDVSDSAGALDLAATQWNRQKAVRCGSIAADQALMSGLKRLIGLPSGSRNSMERLPQGISFGCCNQSVTKMAIRSRSRSTSSTSNSRIAE
jgi:hypothetical protein